ncbi:YitT family protein [Acidaminococcus sp.]|uniref:YitT family protein n=1 Tax=Acidaminococcus sp. TaxID=1872103 RepID=UPI003D7D9A05
MRPAAENIAFEVVIDCFSSFLIGVSIVFAQQANFAPGGITGMGLILNLLTGWPIGQLILMLNVPIGFAACRYLGRDFFLRSIKTMVISSFFIDFVAIHLPVFQGGRLIASILSGIFAGLGFALIYLQNSSTGGSDFLILAFKKKEPSLSIGQITCLLDGLVILGAAFIYKELITIWYGIVYTATSSFVIDIVMKGIITCPPNHPFRFLVADYRD